MWPLAMMPEDEAMPSLPPLEIQNCVLLVRTSFSNDAGWASLSAAVAEPTVEGFLAGVELVDEAAYSGARAEELWSVENNLSIANMDWDDFVNAAHEGVFRGFTDPA